MKLIPLSQGKFAQVDDENYDFLMQWKWYAHKHIKHNDNLTYAIRNIPAIIDKPRTAIKMHRLIMGVTNPEIKVDHRDHNGLNCQKSNMRICSNKENIRNRSATGASKYLGVSFFRLKKLKDGSQNPAIRWRATLKIKDKKKSCLGVYKTQEEAARAYDAAAKIHYVEFANLNFKNEYYAT